MNRRSSGSSLRAAKTRTPGFLHPRRQHGRLSASRTSSRSGGAVGFFTVATAGFKNGDVHGDTRGYRNGHAKSEQYPPTTTKGVAADREENQTGGAVVSEGLFASLDDGIVDASDRGMSSNASSNVVPDDLRLPNPATMTGSRGEGEGGEGDGSKETEGRKATSTGTAGTSNIATEFNVGDDTRWPAFSETSWEFNESTAMARGAMGPLVAPPWRVMLLSDGSVTRHLQLLTDAKIKVEVLRHNVISPADLVDDQSVPTDVLKKLIPHRQQRLDNVDDKEERASECDADECDVSEFETPASCGVSQVRPRREKKGRAFKTEEVFFFGFRFRFWIFFFFLHRLFFIYSIRQRVLIIYHVFNTGAKTLRTGNTSSRGRSLQVNRWRSSGVCLFLVDHRGCEKVQHLENRRWRDGKSGVDAPERQTHRVIQRSSSYVSR